MPKTIIFSGNTAWSMYNFRKNVIGSFVEKGFRVIVIAPEDDEFGKKIKSIGCEFIPIKISGKGVNPINDFQIFLSYIKIFRKYKPDFCFFYTIKPNIYGSLAAKVLKIRHVAITTGLGYVFLSNGIVSKIAKKLYKISFKNVEQIWFLNEDDYDAFRKEGIVSDAKCHIMKGGEGIDLTSFQEASQPESISFLLMARMLWDKGVGVFADAARELKKKYPEVEFHLLGFVGVDNPSAISIEQIRAWEKEGIVKYLGVTNDVRPFIANASCIVLPSFREGIPLALLEGAAMGKPLITTNTPGCKEVVDNEINGFLCCLKDVKSLHEAMEKVILMSEEERTNMGHAGRKKIEMQFDVKNTTKQYFDAIIRN